MKRNKKIALALIVIVAVGAALAAWYYRMPKLDSTTSTSAKTERKILYWTDPMLPGFKSDKPGKSPMNMDMVPVYEGETAADDANSVTVASQIVNNLGVRTHQVKRADAVRRLSADGYLFREGGHLLALVDILGHDASSLRPGMAASLRVTDIPGGEWSAVVASIERDIDIGGRSIKVRLRIKNADTMLKPNMFAKVTILVPASGNYLSIPRQALIRTGTRSAVILALGDGKFQPTEVVPGEESGDWIEIRQGLKEGDTVVVSGQFLIDSEANVRASFERMESTPANSSAPSVPNHAQH
ncbi:MAG: efflux RND transporter periplasmic adaptor subunit [Gammaproteobacteria bacterium]|nr:efflux RND transporter periplasmic adaptor subunit [Gammaproteobacteria bacterium]